MILLLLIPVLMIVWGLRWRKHPPAYPKHPDTPGLNIFIGYNTEWSIKSPDTWYYSHVSYGRMIFPLGILALVVNILGLVFLPLAKSSAVFLLVIDLICIMAPYYPIEKKMRNLFDRFGKWKEE